MLQMIALSYSIHQHRSILRSQNPECQYYFALRLASFPDYA